MRTAPIPARARDAAIQPTSKGGTARVMSRGIGPSRGPLGTSAADRNYLGDYQGWQADAKRMSRTVGVARFTANVTAQAAGGCRLTVEQKQGTEWVETEDSRLDGIMDDYRNETFGQGSGELVRLHAWHYCLDPSTRVLGDDLRWRPISEFHVGDGLVAFDEFAPALGVNRKIRHAEVVSVDRIMRPCYRLTFTDGRTVVSSAEHMWLTTRSENDGAWRVTADLRPGSVVRDLGQPWDDDETRGGGYLAGAFDGEACLSSPSQRTAFLSFAQKPGEVLDEVERCLKERDYRFQTDTFDNHRGVSTLLLGGLYNSMRFLGSVRPERFMPRAVNWLEGRSTRRRVRDEGGHAVVESIEFVGEREVVAMGTTTSTLFAEGLFSHNCVAGEGLLALRDDQKGLAEYLIVSTAAVDWDNPHPGDVTVRLVPGGTVREETAFVVPRDYMVRFWIPDEEWLLHAVSPMTAAMDDLKRYRSLTRFAQRQADNYLAMNGVMWTPLSAHENDSVDAAEDLDGDGTQRDRVLETYEHFARTAMVDDNALESVIPPMVWWEGEPPQWVEVGRGLDEHGMAHRKEALEDWARGVDLPAQLVVGGGTADSNHWGAWLVDDKFFQSGVAPTMDRITHQDITVAYLIPRLRLMGGYDPSEWRVGYDAADVLIKPDKSDAAARGFLSGLVGSKTTRREMGFTEADAPTPEDLKLLKDILTGFGDPNAPGQAPGQKPTLPGEAQRPGQGMPPPNARTKTQQQPPQRPQAALAEMTGPHRTWIAASKADEYTDSVMVALPIPADVATAAAVPDGEPPESMHMTLAVIDGKVGDLDPEMRDALVGACQQVAEQASAPPVDLTHMDRFVASGDDGLEPAALVDGGPEVPALREALCTALSEMGIPYGADHAFRPHVTVGYWPPGEGPERGPLDEAMSYEPEGIAVHWGPEVTLIPFGPGSAAESRTAYAESQPRDDSGRWGDTGAGAREKNGSGSDGHDAKDKTRDGKTPGSLTKKGMVVGGGQVVKIGDRVMVRVPYEGGSRNVIGKVREVDGKGQAIGVKEKGGETYMVAPADVVPKPKDDEKPDWFNEALGIAAEQGDNVHEFAVGFLVDRGKQLRDDAAVFNALLGDRAAAALAAFTVEFPGSSLAERAALLAAWDESLHPRGEGGRFGEGNGGEMSPRGDAVAQSIMDRVAAQGGLSVKPLTGEEPTTGFMVARDPAQQDPDTGASMTQPVPAAEFFASVDGAAALIDTFIADRAAEFADGAWLGLWHDTEHDEVVLDVVDNVTGSANDAIAAGAAQNQQSIWDVENGVEIETGGTGGREQFTEAASVRSAGTGEHDGRGAGSVRTAGSRSRAREDAAARERGRRAAAREVAATKKTQDRVLKQLTSIRRDTGRKLLAGAEVAFAEALRLVGVRATQKAKNRKPSIGPAVAQAAADGQALAPFFAAMNVNEADLLAGAFTSYQLQAQKWLEEQRAAERRALREAERFSEDEVVDFAPEGDDHVGTGAVAAAALLAWSLLSLARGRVVNGVDETTAASPGEVAGAVPASYASRAMGVASGTLSMTLPETPDVLPEVVATGRESIEARAAGGLRDSLLENLTGELRMKEGPEAEGFAEVVDGLTAAKATEFLWVHGFYGTPKTVFEPHEALDGLLTTDPEGDAAVVNDGSWPDEAIYFPGDHAGCTCEYVAQVSGAVADIAAFAEA